MFAALSGILMANEEAGDRFSALILAGGNSTRLGQDKAWLPLAGQPLIQRLIDRLLPLVAELVISTNRPEDFMGLQASLPCPLTLVPDQQVGIGPLAGLFAGLRAARHPLVFALAVDMPFVNPLLLRHMATLAEGYDAVVPRVPVPGKEALQPEPLHALYRRTCLPAIEQHLAAGHRQVISFLPDVQTRYLIPAEIVLFDPHYLSFFNINTPADWERARQMAAPER